MTQSETRQHLERIPRPGERVEMRIEALDVRGGEGIARWPVWLGPQRDVRELTVRVRGALPGERVVMRVESARRGEVCGGIETLLEASPQRIEPRCRHAGRREEVGKGCGGCTLQALPYAAQLAHKQALVEAQLASAGIDAAVRPIIPQVGGEPWFYRNKMEFGFGRDREGRYALGLHPTGYRHEVLRLEECWLESREAVALLHAAREHAESAAYEPYLPRDGSGWLRTMTVREGKRTGERMVILNTSDAAQVPSAAGPVAASQAVRALAQALLDAAQRGGFALDSVIHERQRTVRGERTTFAHETLHGRDVLTEALHLASPGGGEQQQRLVFEVHPRAFFQPNTLQAEVLYGQVLAAALAGAQRPRLALDLYCGTGTIGLCLAPWLERVIGVELVPEAVENARRNASLNGLDGRIEWFAGDVRAVLSGALARVMAAREVDLVVVDPPRAGLMPEAVGHLEALGAPALVYVSCNPESLGRDLARLTRAGYAVDTVQPVDMFPQTGHVETVVRLTRQGR